MDGGRAWFGATYRAIASPNKHIIKLDGEVLKATHGYAQTTTHISEYIGLGDTGGRRDGIVSAINAMGRGQTKRG